MTGVVARTLAVLGAVALLMAAWLDLSVWLIDLRAWPAPMRLGFMLTVATLWLAWAVQPGRGASVRSVATLAATASLACVAGVDAIRFLTLVARGQIEAGVLAPMSLGVLGTALFIGWRQARPRPAMTLRRSACAAAATVGAAGLLFTLGQIWSFGKTDYRRPAEVAVVFGARAYADGRPSDALADRVRTACELYHQGLVDTLLFSGGPGDGSVHETEAMRRMAIGLDVPDRAIRLDPDGLSTRATVQSTGEALRGRRVIAVSHFYHLPRVKMTFQRAGIEVYTVPARERYTLTKMPLLIARECVAIWYYLLAV